MVRGSYADMVKKGIEKSRVSDKESNKDKRNEEDRVKGERREGEACCCENRISNIDYFKRKFGEQNQQLLIEIRESNKEILKEIRYLKEIIMEGFKLKIDKKEEKKSTITNTQWEVQSDWEKDSEEEEEKGPSFVNLNKYKSGNNNKNKFKNKDNDNQSNIMEY